MKILAVNGWGLKRDWFHRQVQVAFPAAAITVIQPPETDVSPAAALEGDAKAVDLYLGYSLGSLWLIGHRRRIPAGAKKALLAPILAFPSEKNMGGCVTATQLRYLIRALRRAADPRPLLASFYRDAGLGVLNDAFPEPADPVHLIAGLEYLLNTHASALDAEGFITITGEHDPLLDSGQLQRILPGLEIVPITGHAPLPLLKKLAALMRA